MKELTHFTVGDTQVLYYIDDQRTVQLSLLPVGYSVVPDEPSREQLSPVADVKIRGDAATGDFGSGRSMRFGGSYRQFKYASHTLADHRMTVVLEDPRGYTLTHCLSWYGDSPVFVSRTSFANHSPSPVTLDFLTSFVLGGLPGYVPGPAFERLVFHRYRSTWSSEALHTSALIEDLGLERVWEGKLAAERYGQVGTMPVRGYHPIGILEDTEEEIFWGAQIAWSGSWQMELVRNHADTLSLDGGLADREFGHWSKTIAPGESFETPEAFLACRKGDFDDICQRLLEIQERRLNVPPCEEDLPIIFNEWCYSWGNPRESEALAVADRLKGTPVKYLVLDAGWYKEEGRDWARTQGDWEPNPDMYPDGIGATAARIRERGLIPGIWFEAEVASCDSHAFHDDVAMHLRLDGTPILVSNRHFLDLQHPDARRKLHEKVSRFVKENGFGYVKIDHNETLGIGCDHPDSPGEGLRRQVEGTHWFFNDLRETNPDLVIENCASGGHRLEPKMMSLCSMASFSDAHREPEIPVIAAALHNLILPRQCQIWAVLDASYSDEKNRYILGSAMLGRLCLSGGIAALSEHQWSIVKDAMDFYLSIRMIIRDGVSAYFPDMMPARRRLRGAIALRRTAKDGMSAVVYAFFFNEQPPSLRVPLLPGEWEVDRTFGDGSCDCQDDDIILRSCAPMTCLIAKVVRR